MVISTRRNAGFGVPITVSCHVKRAPAWLSLPSRSPIAGPEFALEAASAGQRLAYRFHDGSVEVLYWASYDRPRGVDPSAYPLLEGVAAFQLAYLSKDGAWVDTWPRTGESDLPRAVKVDLTLVSGETIERWLALR